MAQIESLEEYPAGMPFVTFYNMDIQALDIEIGFPTARSLPGKGEVQPAAIPAGPVATCEYTGPYEELAAPYEALKA